MNATWGVNPFPAAWAAYHLICFEEAYHCAHDGSFAAVAALPEAEQEAERAAQCRLLRDIAGPRPFRRLRLEAGRRACQNEVPAGIAARIYQERAFDRLPVLADALEDAGCADADLLAHCRGSGEHVRGCWAVDLLLGKR
jgi:hypothetical protein